MRSAASSARQTFVPRRVKRLEESQEIQVRSIHRRRKLLTRGGVLAGFAMTMVIYPAMGTIAPQPEPVDSIPGVVRGENPSTAHALLGSGPTLVSSDLPLPSPDDQARAMAVNDRYTVSQYLPNCDASAEVKGGNGELNEEALCEIHSGDLLRADAAVAFAELNERFKNKFGRDICVYEGYRSLSKQYETKRRRGFLAASPGTSVHGWGLAFDLCGGDDRGETKQWLESNGPAYGWVNPLWAKTRKFEPWHYEYKPGTDAMDLYGSDNWESDGGRPDSDSDSGSSSDSSDSDSGSSTPSKTTPAPKPTDEPTDDPTDEPEPTPSPTASGSSSGG